MKPFSYDRSTALVTGASSGIGREIVRLLARRGARSLVLVARSQNKMEELAAELRARHGAALSVFVVPADLSDAAAPARVASEVAARGLSIDLLVNNAGFGSHGFFDERPAERETDMVDLNVRAVVALSRLFLPGMVARGRGAIVNVASTAGFQPVPFMATYGATKAFVLSFSEALWAENQDRIKAGADIRMVCLCPGGTDTPFDFGSAEMRGRFDSLPQSRPEDVARAGLDALDKNASFVVVGAANYAGALLPRFLPRSVVARTAAALFRPASAPKGGNDKKSAVPVWGTALVLLVGTAWLAWGREKT